MGRRFSLQLARAQPSSCVINCDHYPFLSLILLLFLVQPSPALALSFNYPSMGTFAKDFLEATGNASFKADYVDLTWFASNPRLSTGSVSNKDKLFLWDSATGEVASFNCSFMFSIIPISGMEPADGLAFFLIDPSLSGKTIPSKGGGLGLPAYPNNSIATGVVAVEFDTFLNSQFDPNDNHVGIDINSLSSSMSSSLPFSLTQSPSVFCWVDYSSSKSLLEVYATHLSSTKPTFPILFYDIDLSLFLPEYVTLGFSAATGAAAEHHRIHSWSFTSTSIGIRAPAPAPEETSSIVDRSTSKNKGFHGVLIAGLTVAGVLVGVAFLVLCLLQKRPQRQWQRLPHDHVPSGIGLSEFPSPGDVNLGTQEFLYRDLSMATNNFGEDCLLGEGVFGSVYKGLLPGSGGEVAVKRIPPKSSQGEREFFAEVSIISRIRHENLVQLKGWCRDRSNLLLVYEYVCNGSLDRCLFSKTPSLILDWSKRYNIACGLGFAIQYLHQGCKKVILHRDIKASNVMLDVDYNAKLGDFGLGRQLGAGMEVGTIGYVAPVETCNRTGQATTMSDVYSYGMVLLEVVCGRRRVDDKLQGKFEGRLLDWVWELHSKGELREASDSKLQGAFDEEQLVRTLMVALACLHPDPRERPSILGAVEAMQGRVPLPVVPRLQPAATTDDEPSGPTPSSVDGSTSTRAISTSSNNLIPSSFFAADPDMSEIAPLLAHSELEAR